MFNTLMFRTLKGANFFRFGNEEFVFDFKDGVIGLIGDNGIGKTAILDAVCVCIYNETYRKSTQDEWTNNINEKGLYLNLQVDRFTTTLDRYLIMRRPTSRKSAEKLIVYKNDEIVTGVTNLQEYIENVIIGFGINMFRNAVAVSGGTPFISMTPEDKRKFSDNLFSIKQLRDYKKKANEQLSDLQVTKRIVAQEILGAENKLQEYSKVVNLYVASTDEQIEAVNIDICNAYDTIDSNNLVITNAQAEIVNLESSIVSVNEQITKLEQKLVDMNAREIYSQTATVKSELDSCVREYKAAIANSVRIAPDVICNSCGNSYSQEQADLHKQKHIDESVEIAAKGKILKARLLKLQEELPKIESINSTITSLKYSELTKLKNEVVRQSDIINRTASHSNSLLNVVSSLNVRKDKILSQVDNVDVKVFAQKSIDDAKLLIETKILETQVLDRKILALQYIVDMCSDSGIKRMLLSEFMPILNRLISYYLDKFDLPVVIEFDEYFNHKMTAPKGLGQKHHILSKGQRTRINLAILFAIVDLVKRMGNVQCNLLMLDEFADEGLDPKGFEAAVKAIRNVADDGNKSVVLITHNQEDVLFDNLDALYAVELKNQFSILKEVKTF